MHRDNRKEPGDERGRQIGGPVAQAGLGSDVRLEEPGYQGDNAQKAQEQNQHRNQDNQQQEVNDNDEEEDHERDQESDLSRKNINKQVAEMQEHYDQKQMKQQQHQQQQQEEMTLPQEQGGEIRQRSLYRQVAPIPAVRRHRQDTAEEHKDQSDGR